MQRRIREGARRRESLGRERQRAEHVEHRRIARVAIGLARMPRSFQVPHCPCGVARLDHHQRPGEVEQELVLGEFGDGSSAAERVLRRVALAGERREHSGDEMRRRFVIPVLRGARRNQSRCDRVLGRQLREQKNMRRLLDY